MENGRDRRSRRMQGGAATTVAATVTAALVVLAAAGAGGCGGAANDDEETASERSPEATQRGTETQREAPPLDTERIAEIVGIEGTEEDGRYKIAVPQEGLGVAVDGFRIVPPMGATSWAAFAAAPGGAVVMGDLVLLEDEIGAVEKALVEGGLQVSALHNHFVRDDPGLMFLHLYGRGPAQELAVGVRAALDRIGELRGRRAESAAAGAVETTFDAKRIDEILGHQGQTSRGVYKVTVGRPDVTLSDDGVEVTSFMGFNTWVAMQGSAERAAVAGDFVMLADEVAPVVRALVEHDIEVVALHNHMVHEEPRVFFLHYWGVGPAEGLARGLRAALDRTGAGSSITGS